MSKKTSFSSDTKFFGERYFPYGLSRSGEFTRAQVELLESHGKAYESLHLGKQEALTQEEKEFVAVCLGEKEPETSHEKVWSLFCRKTTQPPVVSAFGSMPSADTGIDHTEYDIDSDN